MLKRLIMAVLMLGPSQVSLGETVVPHRVVADTVPVPLTRRPGDAHRGRALAAGRRANCLGCHRMPISEEPFHGTTGPDLHGVGDRYAASQLRLRLIDPTLINADTLMPSFHKVQGLHRVAPNYRGKPILNAQEIEDVIAYLLTLKDE